MKALFFLIATVCTLSLAAQPITKVSLQASGLTCSMCSNAIYKSLKTVDFVDKIAADIQTSTFDIIFKSGSHIDFEKLKKKVEDAGFFVSRFVATIQFNHIPLASNEPVTIDGKTFQFLNVKDGVVTGEKRVTILNKGFVSSKEYKKQALTEVANVYYAVI